MTTQLEQKEVQRIKAEAAKEILDLYEQEFAKCRNKTGLVPKSVFEKYKELQGGDHGNAKV